MADLLDIGFPDPDPQVVVDDATKAGVRMVGLYAINLSAPGTVQTAAYAQAVAAGGVQVLPIITPGQNPPAVAGIVRALSVWGLLNRLNAVGLDIEQPGIDTPAPLWVQALVNALEAAGYVVWIYTNLRTQYPWGEHWAVDWDHGSSPILPAGAVAVQMGVPFVGRKGNDYDQSIIAAATLAALEDSMTPEQDARLTAIFQQLTQSAAAGQIPTRGQQLEELFDLLTNGGNPALLNPAYIKAMADAVAIAAVNQQPVLDAIAGLQATLGRIEAALKAA